MDHLSMDYKEYFKQKVLDIWINAYYIVLNEGPLGG